MKLTVKSVENLRPGRDRLEVPDALSGVRLVIQPSGAKSWCVRYRHGGRTRKLTIGAYPKIGLADARKLASKALVRVAEGHDPAADKVSAKANTIAVAVDEFLDRHIRRNCRPQTIAERERQFRNHVLPRWRHRPVGSITRRDVVKLLDEVVDVGPVAANRLRTALTTFFGWCVARDVVATSPMIGVKAPSVEQPRDRVLSDDELAAVWKAAEEVGFPFGDVVRLLILSGQRRSEVGGLRWSEIDLEARLWRLPASRTKNGRANEIALSGPAIAILRALPRIDRPCVFTNGAGIAYTAGKQAIDALLPPMPRWTLHDLRRTCASGMARLGVAVHVTEAVLNHRSGTISGYNRHDYGPEKTHALETWAAHVADLVSDHPRRNVVRLRKGDRHA